LYLKDREGKFLRNSATKISVFKIVCGELHFAISQLLTIKITVFCDVTPGNLIDGYEPME
jgi:hypothetical protein